MMNDPTLHDLGNRLERLAAVELRAEMPAAATSPRWGRLRRPRLLAGSSLGLAGIGAAVVLVLGGTAATPAAFAITRHADGSVLVTLNAQEDLGQANQKLTAMGINEQITLYSNPQPTASAAPEDCTPAPGAGTPDPQIRLIVSTDNADNTGTTGAVLCVVAHSGDPAPEPGASGSTGSPSPGG